MGELTKCIDHFDSSALASFWVSRNQNYPETLQENLQPVIERMRTIAAKGIAELPLFPQRLSGELRYIRNVQGLEKSFKDQAFEALQSYLRHEPHTLRSMGKIVLYSAMFFAVLALGSHLIPYVYIIYPPGNVLIPLVTLALLASIPLVKSLQTVLNEIDKLTCRLEERNAAIELLKILPYSYFSHICNETNPVQLDEQQQLRLFDTLFSEHLRREGGEFLLDLKGFNRRLEFLLEDRYFQNTNVEVETFESRFPLYVKKHQDGTVNLEICKKLIDFFLSHSDCQIFFSNPDYLYLFLEIIEQYLAKIDDEYVSKELAYKFLVRTQARILTNPNEKRQICSIIHKNETELNQLSLFRCCLLFLPTELRTLGAGTHFASTVEQETGAITNIWQGALNISLNVGIEPPLLN